MPKTIDSVLNQSFTDYEYFVQDPGSSDGSRDLISSYSSVLTPIFVSDTGPADGLNISFARATGQFYLYVNSDDLLLPGALDAFHKWIITDQSRHAVYSGASSIIDDTGRHLRYAYSDKMNLKMCAYGQSILIQPSSVINADAFWAVGGFNVSNKSNWDGELFIDIAMKGYNFARSLEAFSCYRVHPGSITGSGSLSNCHSEYSSRMFHKITGANIDQRSLLLGKYYWIKRRILTPWDALQRVLCGPIFGSAK